MRLAVSLSVLLLASSTALAGARGFKAAKRSYDDAREQVEGGALRDKEKVAVLLVELEAHTKQLLQEDPAKGADHLLEYGLQSPDLRIARMAVDALSGTKDKRAVRSLAKAYSKAKGERKLLLSRVLGEVPGKGPTVELVKALKDRDAGVRARAVMALTRRGADAKAIAAGPLKRLLKDSSLRVRCLTAEALAILTGERPKGFPAPSRDPDSGIPDAFVVDRVAFLLDATGPMALSLYQDPFATTPEDEAEQEPGAGDAEDTQEGAKEGPEAPKRPKRRKRRRGKGAAEEAKQEQAAPVSPYKVAGDLVRKAIAAMSSDTEFHLARFGRELRAYKNGYGPAPSPRKTSGLDAWLSGKLSRETSRNISAALERLLEPERGADEVYLFLSGPPTRRGRDVSAETLEDIRKLLWARDVRVHVVAFSLPPVREPSTEQARQLQDDAARAYGQFVSNLAKLSGGVLTRLPLVTRVAEAEDGETADKKRFPVDLTKPIARKDVSVVKKALQEAFSKADADAEAFVEEVSACPDPSKVAVQLMNGLTGGDPRMARAVARGVARNPNTRIREFVFKALERERDPAKQILLLSAVGPAKGPEATAGLVAAVARLEADPARVAWSYLAERPASELAAHKGDLVRPAKGLRGLTAFSAAKAMAKANGRPAPAEQGLGIAQGRFLPGRYMGTGTAFVVDTYRSMDAVFWRPPVAKKPAAPKNDAGKKKKKKKRPKKAKRKKDPKQVLAPVSTLQAAGMEIARALKAIAQGEGKANILTTSSRAWQPRCADLSKSDKLKAGVAFAAGLTSSGGRDVWTPLRKALEDPAVEEIYLLISGLPLRSVGARRPDELLQKIRSLNRKRELTIQIVYLLAPVDPDDRRAIARRTDELNAMNDLYELVATQNGGRILTRGSLEGLGKRP